MTDPILAQIRDALSNLAMAPQQQLDRVQGLGVEVDELALEFDDVGRTRRKLVTDGVLSADQAAAIAAVERQLSRMTSTGPTRWSDEAVLTGEDWEELRRLARSALAVLV